MLFKVTVTQDFEPFYSLIDKYEVKDTFVSSIYETNHMALKGTLTRKKGVK
jgi:hypothetical protein